MTKKKTQEEQFKEIIDNIKVDTRHIIERAAESKRSKSEEYEWGKIIRAAKVNPTLQKALDRAKMIYELSKDPEVVNPKVSYKNAWTLLPKKPEDE